MNSSDLASLCLHATYIVATYLAGAAR